MFLLGFWVAELKLIFRFKATTSNLRLGVNKEMYSTVFAFVYWFLHLSPQSPTLKLHEVTKEYWEALLTSIMLSVNMNNSLSVHMDLKLNFSCGRSHDFLRQDDQNWPQPNISRWSKYIITFTSDKNFLRQSELAPILTVLWISNHISRCCNLHLRQELLKTIRISLSQTSWDDQNML